MPDQARTCLGLEYFCFEGDGLWSMTDCDLVTLATRELAQLGIAKAHEVIDGYVVRVPKAYRYDEGFTEALDIVRAYFAAFENLQLIGRNGMHKLQQPGSLDARGHARGEESVRRASRSLGAQQRR